MASARDKLRGLILSAVELKQINSWSDSMIEDYLNIFDNIISLADTIDENEATSESFGFNQTQSQLNELASKVGSCDPLTSDDTGFTVDSIKLTVDMDEA